MDILQGVSTLPIVPEHELQQIKKLGSGSFATVLLCWHKPSHGSHKTKEYLPGGPLSRVLLAEMARSSWARGYTLADSIRWAINIAEALEYLHNHNPKVIHRDLKLSNILLNSTDLSCAEACVADFGLHASVPQQQQSLLLLSSSQLDFATGGEAAAYPASLCEAANGSPTALPAAAAKQDIHSVPIVAADGLSPFANGNYGLVAAIPAGAGLSSAKAAVTDSSTGSSHNSRPYTSADVAELQLLFSTSCMSAMQRKGRFSPRSFRKTAALAASSAAADDSTPNTSSVLKLSLSKSSSQLIASCSSGSGWKVAADDSAAGGGRNPSVESAGMAGGLCKPHQDGSAGDPPALAVDAVEAVPSISPDSAVPSPTGGLRQVLRKASSKSKADAKGRGSIESESLHQGPSAAAIESARQLTARTGSLVYMAPEVFMGKPYDEKADVFSFGIMLYELLHHQLLQMTIAYGAASGPEALYLYAISMAEDNFRPPINPKLPQPLQQLLMDCWAANPQDRPDMGSVLQRLRAIEPELPVRNSLFRKSGAASSTASGSRMFGKPSSAITLGSTVSGSGPASQCATLSKGTLTAASGTADGFLASGNPGRLSQDPPSGCFACCGR
eukprot:gene10792-10949_t